MKRLYLLLFLALACLAQSTVFLKAGFDDFSRPSYGLKVIFNVDFGRLKAFSTVDLEFSFERGNLKAEMSVEDPTRWIVLDIDEVFLKTGYIENKCPAPVTVEPADWLLRIYNTYIVFSNSRWMYSFTGSLFFGVSNVGQWKMGLALADEDKGMYVYRTDESRAAFALQFYSFVLVVEDGIRVSYIREGSGFSLKFSGSDVDFWGVFRSGDDYLFFKKGYVELVKKVGIGYAIWEFSGKSKELSIGYELGF